VRHALACILRILSACALLVLPCGPATAADRFDADLAVAELAARPAVRDALAGVDGSLDRYVEEWIRIAQIPAPSGQEGRRASFLEARFRELGLVGVERDGAGNVVGRKSGIHPQRPALALIAHMDTVASARADHTVRRPRPDRLQAPGVRDDSSGLAAVLALLDLMQKHDLRPDSDLYVVASASEEVGLKGAERFVSTHAGELGAVIAVDGHLGQISYAATGIAWLKLRFLGGAAHTLRAHEKPSAVLAVGRAIERIAALDVRRTPPEMESWINVGMIGGGEVPNAQPEEAWLVVDIRSNDPALFEELQQRVRDIASRTAREAGVEAQVETLHRMAGATLPGSKDSALVRSARAVLDRLGWSAVEVTPRGTADHNVALARGIPGIAIGITTGDGAHTPEEYADVPPFALGVKQLVLLSLLPLTTVNADSAGQESGAEGNGVRVPLE
jgi:tripeptide aminopeptidase